MKPVTTSDCSTFTFENGSAADAASGVYLEFTLHFMAEKDMIVHLTSANSSSSAEDGTLISSGNSQLPQAMRISIPRMARTGCMIPAWEIPFRTAARFAPLALEVPLPCAFPIITPCFP